VTLLLQAPPLAIFGDLGLQELLVVALAAVMIFGRRLPEVAGRGFAQFQRARRTLTRMWRETGIENEIKRIQRDLDREMPRDFDPAKLARRETREIERRLKSDARSQPRGARGPSMSQEESAAAAQAIQRSDAAPTSPQPAPAPPAGQAPSEPAPPAPAEEPPHEEPSPEEPQPERTRSPE
jgi:Sec-independent protein translocase protein TatA